MEILKKKRMTVHIPVLLKEVINNLNLEQGDIVVDGTLGGGGYFQEICRFVGEEGTVIGIDQDAKAIELVEQKMGECESCKCKKHFIKENFRNLDKVLGGLDISKINGLVLDIGLSSDQFEQSGRGFSFQKDEPLLMTFQDKDDLSGVTFTAKDIVNTWDEENLVDILSGYGEERYSKRIVKKIVELRKEKSIETTFDLVEVIRQAIPIWATTKKLHFATKTFQALRVTVNDELGALREGLEKGFEALDKDGRMAVVSFHSLEDRIVKNFMRDRKKEGTGVLISKKPITASRDEILTNPRSRSAKLRVIQKI